MTLKIALAQINCTVGDLTDNAQCIAAAAQHAAAQHADVLLTPELSLTGYPPEDLLLRDDFYARSRDALQQLAHELAALDLYVIVGVPWQAEHAPTLRYNSACVLHRGAIVARYDKQHLPNYGVFDEARYFTAGQQALVITIRHTQVGINICEDAWLAHAPQAAKAAGAQILLLLNASPYDKQKPAERLRTLQTRVCETGLPLVYVNLVGGQDELVFDGASLALDAQGKVSLQLAPFVEALDYVELRDGHLLPASEASQPSKSAGHFYPRPIFDNRERTGGWAGVSSDTSHVHSLPFKGRAGVGMGFSSTPLPTHPPPNLPREGGGTDRALQERSTHLAAQMYQALVLGVRDYLRKNNFRGALLGLSGGVDSALVLAIAVDALGAEHVRAVMMPSPYTADISRIDARQLAKNFGVRYEEIDIEPLRVSFTTALAAPFTGRPIDTTEENLQARIRGTLLMALSNKFGDLVLTTGNKSELATGYCTLYGDMAGGFAVIKDLLKTEVYALCAYRNSITAMIPERILTRAPSAELRPDQTDQDSLPPYEQLDGIVQRYMEQNQSVADIIAAGFSAAHVTQVVRLLHINEYKRRQAPPGIRLSTRAFGRDWRYPISAPISGKM